MLLKWLVTSFSMFLFSAPSLASTNFKPTASEMGEGFVCELLRQPGSEKPLIRFYLVNLSFEDNSTAKPGTAQFTLDEQGHQSNHVLADSQPARLKFYGSTLSVIQQDVLSAVLIPHHDDQHPWSVFMWYNGVHYSGHCELQKEVMRVE